ncbi:permease-like cell division protein FtsX [Planotetraspora sp. A-T 1434]|uniref:permease-like cell division protein FtsX n=1 Tax=Planotetraspora sp. A-T 1434 TaxID=2979219 RepID=UPI0021BFC33B|nr:permease-like cell division protein FtsX [Planotetraspora sp. A-T 1434]MCT9928812.1 permease-like cell division protein FtsX [Planotetraspora sp. A-T 1434]
MHLSPEPLHSPGLRASEELSFGQHPDRESRARGWLRAHRGLVSVAALSVLLLAGASVGGWLLYQRSRQPLPPPEGPWPQTGYLTVFLCREDDPLEACRDRGGITAEEKRAVEAVLRTSSVIKKFRFETQEEALAKFRATILPKAMKEDPSRAALLKDVEAADLPASYRGTLGAGDWNTVVQRLERLPGISNSYLYHENFWLGKTDIWIPLCPQVGSYLVQCTGHGKATAAEKQAILDRIRGLPGVDVVYFEDSAHGLKVFRHFWWNGGGVDNPAQVPESFYVKFAKPPVTRDIAKSLAGLPGLAGVREVLRSSG